VTAPSFSSGPTGITDLGSAESSATSASSELEEEFCSIRLGDRGFQRIRGAPNDVPTGEGGSGGLVRCGGLRGVSVVSGKSAVKSGGTPLLKTEPSSARGRMGWTIA
jgi:hypothetical protein